MCARPLPAAALADFRSASGVLHSSRSDGYGFRSSIPRARLQIRHHPQPLVHYAG